MAMTIPPDRYIPTIRMNPAPSPPCTECGNYLPDVEGWKCYHPRNIIPEEIEYPSSMTGYCGGFKYRTFR